VAGVFLETTWVMLLFLCHHKLNMELDLQSLFGLHVQCTALLIGCAEKIQKIRFRPSNPPPPPIGLIYGTRTLLVSQDRQHLFVTPCVPPSTTTNPGAGKYKKQPFPYSLYVLLLYGCTRSIPQFHCCYLVSKTTTFSRIALQTHLTLL
jgi:hypothetical protein